MSRRIRHAALASMLLLVFAAAPANAGGWWNYADFDKQHVNVGETIAESGEVSFADNAAARAARSDEYFVYLVRGINRPLLDEAMARPNPRRWWSQPETAHQLGRVSLETSPSNIVTWTAELTVPDVPSGRYAVMLCDAGCRNPLGDTVPTDGVRVYASGAEAAAQAAEAAAGVAMLRDDAEMMFDALAADIDLVREDAARAAEAAAQADAAIRRVEAHVGTLATAADEPVPAAGGTAGWGVAALLAAAWIGFAIGRRTRAASSPPEPPATVEKDRVWEAPVGR